MVPSKIAAKLSSLVWRLLTRYGRIKYRYLLPVYRLFGLLPDSPRSIGTGRPSATLRAAAAIVSALDRSALGAYAEQLKVLHERVRFSKGAVIFLPSVGWDILNTQRPHHLAREFARQGHVSIFDVNNAFDDVAGFKEIESNVFLFRGDPGILRSIRDPIIWALTYNFERATEYSLTGSVVYDWIDELEIFPYQESFLKSNHARALREATIVVSVARRLHDRALALRPDALYLPNAVEERLIGADSVPPDDSDILLLSREGKPVAGYIGALAEWFDYELLESLARLRTDWTFLLIGPNYDLSLNRRGRSLLGLPNVRWIGHRPYASLKAYLSVFDVALIPFVINDITMATSPLKLYEYFAAGKPVIVTRLPECLAFSEVFDVGNVEEFSRALDLARLKGRDMSFVEGLLDLARKNSWTARVRVLLEHLNNHPETQKRPRSVTLANGAPRTQDF